METFTLAFAYRRMMRNLPTSARSPLRVTASGVPGHPRASGPFDRWRGPDDDGRTGARLLPGEQLTCATEEPGDCVV